MCKLWLCRVTHIYLCSPEVNTSKEVFWFYRSYLECIDSAWYYLGIPCNSSRKLKLKKRKKHFLFSLLSKRHRNFPQNSDKDGNTTYSSIFPPSHFFFQCGLCTKYSHFLCMCDQGIHYSGFLRMNVESGSMENKADWRSSEIHFISFCFQLPGFFVREFLLHSAHCVLLSLSPPCGVRSPSSFQSPWSFLWLLLSLNETFALCTLVTYCNDSLGLEFSSPVEGV